MGKNEAIRFVKGYRKSYGGECDGDGGFVKTVYSLV